MEQRYWEQFMKTGGICDYLGYKMEVYSHHRDIREREKEPAGKNIEASVILLCSREDDIA